MTLTSRLGVSPAVARLEDETFRLLEARQGGDRRIEIGAAPDSAVFPEKDVGTALGPGLEDHNQSAIFCQLLLQPIGNRLDSAIQEDHVIWRAGGIAIRQLP